MKPGNLQRDLSAKARNDYGTPTHRLEIAYTIGRQEAIVYPNQISTSSYYYFTCLFYYDLLLHCYIAYYCVYLSYV